MGSALEIYIIEGFKILKVGYNTLIVSVPWHFKPPLLNFRPLLKPSIHHHICANTKKNDMNITGKTRNYQIRHDLAYQGTITFSRSVKFSDPARISEVLWNDNQILATEWKETKLKHLPLNLSKFAITLLLNYTSNSW